MTITLYEHAAFKFQAVQMSGVLTAEELMQLGAVHAQRPDWARADAINLIDEDIDVSEITQAQLDHLRDAYRTLQRQLDLHVVRRAAWVCPSLRAWPLLEYWLADRHSRDGQGTEVCLVANLAEANMMFDPEELNAVRAWDGFTLLKRLQSDRNAA